MHGSVCVRTYHWYVRTYVRTYTYNGTTWTIGILVQHVRTMGPYVWALTRSTLIVLQLTAAPTASNAMLHMRSRPHIKANGHKRVAGYCNSSIIVSSQARGQGPWCIGTASKEGWHVRHTCADCNMQYSSTVKVWPYHSPKSHERYSVSRCS